MIFANIEIDITRVLGGSTRRTTRCWVVVHATGMSHSIIHLKVAARDREILWASHPWPSTVQLSRASSLEHPRPSPSSSSPTPAVMAVPSAKPQGAPSRRSKVPIFDPTDCRLAWRRETRSAPKKINWHHRARCVRRTMADHGSPLHV